MVGLHAGQAGRVDGGSAQEDFEDAVLHGLAGRRVGVTKQFRSFVEVLGQFVGRGSGADRGDDPRFEGGALRKGAGGVFCPLGILAGDNGSVRVGLGGASGDGGGSGVGHREVDVERDACLGS